ncbi:MAG TPA: DUF6600 domain-containing protein, partial [Methylomirabilota bacterium]|nr:DUF6600 domain-containing protein [Methylomirabilota bacterium]
EDWAAARVNTALAPGDELYTGAPGNLEVQIGARAYVRAWANTQLGLANLDPDFLQLKVTAGTVSLDLRRLEPGDTVELDTPKAAFTIERAGYYRVTVTASRTSFITRRGGRATVTPASGTGAAIAPSEEVVVEGADGAQVATYVAPPRDEWDRWNYARTDQLIDSVSARYLSPGIYGIDDLDHYGSWRIIEPYGPVWVPDRVPAGWAPYSTGAWMWYPTFGWTWVDSAPWGWAPYHHGRWVFVSGFWAWAPGPILATPVYAPALVAFFGGRPSVSVGVVGPAVGWVALGWGEPLIPWWGPVGFIGVPWWAGWGGPRIVNNVVVTRTTVVTASGITVYRNIGVRDGVVVVPHDRFGRGPVTPVRIAKVDPSRLEPVRGALGFAPVRASLSPDVVRGTRPPEAALKRPVVTTRAPEDPARWLKPHGIAEPAPPAKPQLVPKPAKPDATVAAPRPEFGPSTLERPRPPRPPGFERQPPAAPRAATPAPTSERPARTTPEAKPRPTPPPGTESRPGVPAPPPRPVSPPQREVRASPPQATSQPTPRVESPVPPPRPVSPPQREVRTTPPQPGVAPRAATPAPRVDVRPLPGEPANRLFPGGRSEVTPRRDAQPSVGAPAPRGSDREDRSQPGEVRSSPRR